VRLSARSSCPRGRPSEARLNIERPLMVLETSEGYLIALAVWSLARSDGSVSHVACGRECSGLMGECQFSITSIIFSHVFVPSAGSTNSHDMVSLSVPVEIVGDNVFKSKSGSWHLPDASVGPVCIATTPSCGCPGSFSVIVLLSCISLRAGEMSAYVRIVSVGPMLPPPATLKA